MDCITCGRSFGSKEALLQHRKNSPAHRKQNSPNQGPNCQSCNKSFSSNDGLQQHLRDSPAHASLFPCDVCNRSFRSDDALQQHKRDSPSHSFECHSCDRAFGSNDALQNHLLTSSAHAHSFSCDACNRSFPNAEALQQHNRDSPAHKHLRIEDALQQLHIQDIPSAKAYQQQTDTAETGTSFMFPALHPRVLDEVSGDIDDVWFEEETNDSISNEHNTHIMGRFRCNTAGCSNGSWGSKKIAIVIRGYPENGYNAVVFNQRCESCNSLGTMTLDEESYVERIAYRLRVWAGVRVERPPFNKRRGPPHIPELCEGCIQGYCQEGEVSVSNNTPNSYVLRLCLCSDYFNRMIVSSYPPASPPTHYVMRRRPRHVLWLPRLIMT